MRVILALIALTLLACTLSNVPPTLTLAPFPTSEPVLPFVTPLPAQPFPAPTGDGSLTSSNPNCPQPGGWILYTVENGDTLSLLSDQTDTPVPDLQTANCITDVDTLYTGQVIYLPRQPIIAP